MKYFVLEFGNKLVHYLEYKFPCLPKYVFSLEKIFLNHLECMTPSSLLDSIHMHMGFGFLQRQLEKLEQESFILENKNFIWTTVPLSVTVLF